MNLNKNNKIRIDYQNKRIKVFDLKKSSSQITQIEDIAENEGLDKIIIFQKEIEEIKNLIELGFNQEGIIDGFYDGESAHILAKYINEERQQTDNLLAENKIISSIKANNNKITDSVIPDNYSIRDASNDDIPQIVDIFNQVFETYPAPMNDEEYVAKAINTNVDLAVIEDTHNRIIGLSSAEIDYVNKNAEITDCATLPSERGKGLMKYLIQYLENNMRKKDIVNLFSIARARSFGMNKVLYTLDYKYRGRLINNVHIAGNWENMNIWAKHLD